MGTKNSLKIKCNLNIQSSGLILTTNSHALAQVHKVTFYSCSFWSKKYIGLVLESLAQIDGPQYPPVTHIL